MKYDCPLVKQASVGQTNAPNPRDERVEGLEKGNQEERGKKENQKKTNKKSKMRRTAKNGKFVNKYYQNIGKGRDGTKERILKIGLYK